MTAQDFLKEGRLADAIASATERVKAAPGDVRVRILLFELLAAAGEFERAKRHLAVVGDRAPEMAQGAGVYEAILDGERVRHALFAEGRGAPRQVTAAPLDPEPYLSALQHRLRGDAAEAERLLEAAEASRSPRPATIDGVAVDDFRDADDVLAAHLEVVGHGTYGWIPFAQIARIQFEEPASLRDLLWRTATLQLTSGGEPTVYVPVRYPGSAEASDDGVRLGRATDWQEGGGVRGIGQRAFLAGDEARYILEVSEIRFDD